MSDPKPGAARQPQRRGHLDGITKMSGNVNFGSTHGSLDVTLDSDGGSTTDTSDFAATAAVNQLPSTLAWQPATLSGNTVTCATLPAGSKDKAYVVKVKYKLKQSDGTKVDKFLSGTIQSAPASGASGITLKS